MNIKSKNRVIKPIGEKPVKENNSAIPKSMRVGVIAAFAAVIVAIIGTLMLIINMIVNPSIQVGNSSTTTTTTTDTTTVTTTAQ